MTDALTVPTTHGPARAHLHAPARTPTAALLLGHRAGGGVSAPGREVVVVPGDHSPRRTQPVRDAVGPWLRGLLDLG